MAATREKWNVEVWDPATTVRYVDAHQSCIDRGRRCGHVRAVGRLAKREYPTETSMRRGVSQLRRYHPTGIIELRRMVWDTIGWFQRGDMVELDLGRRP
jgi:hypothetical protein